MPKRKLFFLSPDGNAGGDPPTEDDKKAAPNAGGNGGEDEKAKQAALNAQFAERAERAAKAERQKFLDGLGLKDEKEFEEFVKAKKARDDEQKTELQKLTEAAANEKARADKLEAEGKAALEAAQKRIQEGEIKLLASQPITDKDGKVIRPAFRKAALEDVAILISGFLQDENGNAVPTDKALDALAKAKPWLLEEVQPAGKPAYGSPPAASKPKQHVADPVKRPVQTL